MPLAFGMLPSLRISRSWADADVAASPEWFGDRMQLFRQVLVRRELAEMLAAASSRDVAVHELDPTCVVSPT